MRYYYTDAANQTQGPLDEMALAQLASSGMLTKNSSVCMEGAREWVPASQLFPALWPNMPHGTSLAERPQAVYLPVASPIQTVDTATPILSYVCRGVAIVCFLVAVASIIGIAAGDTKEVRLSAVAGLVIFLVQGMLFWGYAQMVDYIHAASRNIELMTRKMTGDG